jgi:type 1 fimbria pilin
MFKLLSGLSLALMLCLPSFFAVSASEGVITIIGRIVPDPCVVSPQQRDIHFTCPEGDKMQTRRVSYTSASGGRPVNAGSADISMTYLNTQKTRGIIQVAYH